MGTTTESASDLTKDLNAYTVDLKLEVVVIPVADVDRSKDFYSGSAGGLTPTSDSTTASASCSSLRPDRRARCSSER